MGRLMKVMASLWLTLGLIVLAALVLVHAMVTGVGVGPAIAVPFAGLGANLLAALAVSDRLRRNGPLLAFHLALAALALLAAVGRLTSFTGEVEVTVGAAFTGDFAGARPALLHGAPPGDLVFVQGPFSINYAPGMKRLDTRSVVGVPDGSGGMEERVIGDDEPLVIDGYRFYSTSNKGFAPVLAYESEDGDGATSRTGAVHMPSYPLREYQQGNTITVPGVEGEVTLWLHLPEPAYDVDGPWSFALPARHALVVTQTDGTRTELAPGDTMTLGDGTLRYVDLTTWIGYSVFYDPSLPWMAAAAAVAAGALGWHATRKMMAVMRDLEMGEPLHDA